MLCTTCYLFTCRVVWFSCVVFPERHANASPNSKGLHQPRSKAGSCMGRTLEAPIPKKSGLVREKHLLSKTFVLPLFSVLHGIAEASKHKHEEHVHLPTPSGGCARGRVPRAPGPRVTSALTRSPKGLAV